MAKALTSCVAIVLVFAAECMLVSAVRADDVSDESDLYGGIPKAITERPEGLDPSLDTAVRGDPVVEPEPEPIVELPEVQVVPEGLDPSLDTAVRGDPVVDYVPVELPVPPEQGKPEGLDGVVRGDPVVEPEPEPVARLERPPGWDPALDTTVLGAVVVEPEPEPVVPVPPGYGDPVQDHSGSEWWSKWGVPVAPAPVGLRSTGPSRTSVRLRWSALAGAAGYELEFRSNSSDVWHNSGQVTSGTSRSVNGLLCHHKYHFRVRANGTGDPYSVLSGHPSSSVAARTGVCSAPPPDGLTAPWGTRTSVTLSWNEVTDAEVYKVTYRRAGTPVWSEGGNASWGRHTVWNLSCGTGYVFQVKARGDGYPYSKAHGRASSTVATSTRPCLAPPASSVASAARS